jgi:hypothetical protein
MAAGVHSNHVVICGGNGSDSARVSLNTNQTAVTYPSEREQEHRLASLFAGGRHYSHLFKTVLSTLVCLS